MQSLHTAPELPPRQGISATAGPAGTASLATSVNRDQPADWWPPAATSRRHQVPTSVGSPSRLALSPLQGVRVVVLDGSLAAGFITTLLASQGASVTRVLGPWSPAASRDAGRWLPPHETITVRDKTTAELGRRHGVSGGRGHRRHRVGAPTGVAVRLGGGEPAPGARGLLPGASLCRPGSRRRVAMPSCRVPWASVSPVSRPGTAEPLPIPSVYGALMCAFWIAVAVAEHPGGRPRPARDAAVQCSPDRLGTQPDQSP